MWAAYDRLIVDRMGKPLTSPVRGRERPLFRLLVLTTIIVLTSGHDVAYERFNQAFGTTLAPTPLPSHSHFHPPKSATLASSPSSTSPPSTTSLPSSSSSTASLPPRESRPHMDHFECINFQNDSTAFQQQNWKLFS